MKPIILPVLFLLIACHSADSTTSWHTSLSDIVEAYMDTSAQNNRLSPLTSAILTADTSQGHCELILSNYFTNELCGTCPYILVNGTKLFIDSSRTNCAMPRSMTEGLNYLHCNNETSNNLPIYDPLVWHLKVSNGIIVRKE